MLSQTGNPKLHRIRALAFGSAIASLALSSCAADQTLSMASLGPAPYFALTSSGDVAANSRRSGSFAQENGCVVFKPAGSAPMMTPVFPKGETALVTDGTEWLGLFVHGSPVSMGGEVYRLSGTQTSGGVALATPAPAGCPKSYFVVRNIGQALADANANRYCAGVTICRSFSLF